eukprot:7353569-Prymnesium_polylepis.1
MLQHAGPSLYGAALTTAGSCLCARRGRSNPPPPPRAAATTPAAVTGRCHRRVPPRPLEPRAAATTPAAVTPLEAPHPVAPNCHTTTRLLYQAAPPLAARLSARDGDVEPRVTRTRVPREHAGHCSGAASLCYGGSASSSPRARCCRSPSPCCCSRLSSAPRRASRPARRRCGSGGGSGSHR